MKMLPTSAAANASGRNSPSAPASAVPTSTGEIAAGSVRGRAAIAQMRSGAVSRATRQPLRAAGELREVGGALLAVGVAAFLRLVGHVEEQVGVMRQLLQARKPVLGRVEARLQQAQRER